MPTVESYEKEESLGLKPLKRLHFLIHPGFTFYSGSQEATSLLDNYFLHAGKLDDNEFMILYLLFLTKHIRNEIKGKQKDELATAMAIRNILGRRVAVFTRDVGLPPKLDVEPLAEIIKARGYSFDENVETVAYGETLGMCVSQWADELNRKLRLKSKTKVLTHLTEMRNNPHRIAERIKGLQGEFKRLVYVID